MSGSDFGRLDDWCAKEAIQITDEARSKLRKYLKLLKFWSKKQALVSSADKPVLVEKHLADSLFAAARCPNEGKAADLGSGAGLPGIPLAIVRPTLRVDLVESRAKKASFLSAATAELDNARVVSCRIEDLDGHYDAVLARALAPLDRLMPLARPTLELGGTLIAMKSPSYEEELAGRSITEFGFELSRATEYALPTGEQRVLLELRAV